MANKLDNALIRLNKNMEIVESKCSTEIMSKKEKEFINKKTVDVLKILSSDGCTYKQAEMVIRRINSLMNCNKANPKGRRYRNAR